MRSIKARIIKVFLASSEELEYERLQFADLFNHLNRIFIPMGLYLELSKWEYLDSSMGLEHKQREYNQELKTSEICVVLFWTKFGEYTENEFKTAYKELIEGRNPRKLYVFFKEPADPTQELRAFKENMESGYGHFYCKFMTIDSMRLHFVLQLLTFPGISLDKFVKVEDSNVKMNGKTIANLDNIPFASNNREYIRLKQEISTIQSEISIYEEILATNHNESIYNLLNKQRAKLYYAKEELTKHEENLYNTALRIAQQQNNRISERTARAIKAFEEGRASDANTILEEALYDAISIRKKIAETNMLLKEQLMEAEKSITELSLKASIELSDETIPIEERIQKARQLYEEAYSLANICNYNQQKYKVLLVNYGNFALSYISPKEGLKYYLELLKLTKESDADYPSICQSISLIYSTIEDPINANKYAEISLDAINLSDNESIQVANYYYTLGSAELANGDFEKALNNYNHALRIYKTYEETDLQTSYTYINMARICISNEKYTQSIEYSNKSFEILSKLYGNDTLFHIPAYQVLGEAYYKLGKYDIATGWIDKSINITKTTLGEYNYKLGVLYADLAHIFNSLKNHQKALEYYTESKNILSSIFGERHPSLANTYIGIGDVYQDLGELKKAIRNYKISERILKTHYSESHHTLSTVYGNMALAYSYLGEQLLANEYFSKSINNSLPILGENSKSVARHYFQLGLHYVRFKEYDNSINVFKKSLSINLQILGENHNEVARLYYEIGKSYHFLKKHITAIEYFKLSLKIYESISKTEQLNIARCYTSMGAAHNSLHNYTLALENLDKALKIRISILGENHLDIAETYTNIGNIYISSKLYNDAITYYEKALKIRISILGENHLEVAENYDQIATSHAYLGNIGLQLDYREKSLDIYLSCLGESNARTCLQYRLVEDLRKKLIDCKEKNCQSN